MSIYGPLREDETVASPQGDIDLSPYAKKHNVLSKSGGVMRGELDMGGNRIRNLDRPVVETDVATAGYVSNFVSRINTAKVEKSGDTMTGNLAMSNNRITDVGTPTDETDVVNKQYVDSIISHEHLLKPYDLARYIVFPHEDDTKTYFSVRAKKNVDFDRGLLVEIKNNIADSRQNIVNNNNRDITITSNTTLLPNPNKSLGAIQLNDDLGIEFDSSANLPPPTSLLFTVKPGLYDQRKLKGMVLTFYGNDGAPSAKVFAKWVSDSQIQYRIQVFPSLRFVQNVIIDVPSDQLNHITLVYNGKTQFLLNVDQKRTNNVDLGRLHSISIGGEELGILSLYNRELSKTEIVEHFVEYHVENFTEDEVLI